MHMGLRGLGGDGAVPNTTAASGQDWKTAITDILKTGAEGYAAVSTAKTARELQKINIQRAQVGLDPLDPSVYAPQVRVGLDTGGVASSRNTMLLLVAAGLALYLFMRRRR
jgi:MYXO-CTERM domain-containing protein